MSKDTRAQDAAIATLSDIRDLLKAKAKANDGTEDEQDAARQAIEEMPLSVRPVSCYEILLSTGGPAVRITGQLSEHGEPETAALQWQDWGTLWTELDVSTDDLAALLDFASYFYFAE